MARNIEFFGSLSTPSLIDPEVQKRRSTMRAWLMMRPCSKNFVKKKYQVPIDMTSRMPSTPMETGFLLWMMSIRP